MNTRVIPAIGINLSRRCKTVLFLLKILLSFCYYLSFFALDEGFPRKWREVCMKEKSETTFTAGKHMSSFIEEQPKRHPKIFPIWMCCET